MIEPVLTGLLANPFFRAKPPKTAGREEFGRDFVREFVRLCGRARKQDVVATATALTARSIADAIERFVLRKHKGSFQELILSGGGAKNATLVGMLKETACAQRNCRSFFRRVRIAFRGERSNCVRRTGVRDVAPAGRRIFRPPRGRDARRFWERSRMHEDPGIEISHRDSPAAAVCSPLDRFCFCRPCRAIPSPTRTHWS